MKPDEIRMNRTSAEWPDLQPGGQGLRFRRENRCCRPAVFFSPVFAAY